MPPPDGIGNDTTGNGSITAPYATLNKALKQIEKYIDDIITIKIDSGSFDYTKEDRKLIADKRFVGKYGQLVIWGTFDTLVKGSIIYTQRVDSSFVFDVSGTTFTANEWQYGFGTGYIHVVSIDGERNAAISANGTDWIEISSPTNFKSGTNPQWNYLVKSLTTFDLTEFETPDIDPMAFNFNQPSDEPSIIFSDINFINYNVIELHSPIVLSRCAFLQNNKRIRIFESIESIRLDGIICKGGFTMQGKANIKGGYFTHSSARTASFVKGSYGDIYGCIFEGNGSTEIFRIEKHGSASFDEVKFKDGNQVFHYRGAGNITYYNLLSIENCNYFALSNTHAGAKFYTEDTTDLITRIEFNTGYMDPAGYTKMVDPGTDYCIRLPDVYPEIELNLEETLIDNATTEIVIGDSIQNQSIIIEYTCERNNSIEMGKVSVINRGTTLTLLPSVYGGDAIGLSFTGVVYDSGLIELQCTLTSTGNNATFKYDAFRKLN